MVLRAGRIAILAGSVLVPVVGAQEKPPISGPQATQPIYLQYDGFIRNANGTFTLSFGYFNLNHVDVTIPPGADNRFLAAPADRNQPVTFLQGRHRYACAMVVPATFSGDARWQIVVNGTPSVTTAKVLEPIYELEEGSGEIVTAGLTLTEAPERVCANRAPMIRVGTGRGARQGGPGLLTTAVHQSLTLTAEASDDGLPRNGKLTTAWNKIAGPGAVTFTAESDGVTRAHFDAPGVYELEISASDSERSSHVTVRVTVSPAP